MRLLRTKDLAFEEFYDDQVPPYAILSHRWAAPEQEVSYNDFQAGLKLDCTGHDKIKKFAQVAWQRQLEYCWIDTCCIDKTSSAELTEAINSMYHWYQRAVVCFAYLADTEHKHYLESTWFQRGWTLQELIAPKDVCFMNSTWEVIGTKFDLARSLSTVTGIDQALLRGLTSLEEYSVAQRMSWASKRKTSRREDEAYCLLGLFDVTMPLLYGEGHRAFRRLQEEILSTGEDTSVFAWSDGDLSSYRQAKAHSILAPSPANFQWSANVIRGFATQRILFDVTNRGMMILIHHSYDPETLDTLLSLSKDIRRLNADSPLGLTIPLGCYQQLDSKAEDNTMNTAIFLSLMLDGGKWRRIGITSYHDPESTVRFSGAHYSAYKNDYVRIYVHHELPAPGQPLFDEQLHHVAVRYLHLRDSFT